MSRMRNWRAGPVPPGRSTNVRLLISIGMLVILALLILQAAEPRNWIWLTGEQAERKPVFAEYAVQDGPTDLDEKEWAEAAKNFDLVKDKLAKDDLLNAVQKNRFLKWVLCQKPADLYRRQPATERLQDLLNRPNDFRGKLVRLRLSIKRCLPLPSPDPSNPNFANLHEMVGFQDKTGLWLYWLFTPSPPKDFPTGEQIDAQTVDVVGYFHTLRLFMDGNEKTSLAPEIVGAAVWYPIEKSKAQPLSLPLVIGFAAALPIGGLVLWRMLRGPQMSPSFVRPRHSEVDVEDWLAKGPEIGTNVEPDDVAR
jgi:hypothetical protein